MKKARFVIPAISGIFSRRTSPGPCSTGLEIGSIYLHTKYRRMIVSANAGREGSNAKNERAPAPGKSTTFKRAGFHSQLWARRKKRTHDGRRPPFIDFSHRRNCRLRRRDVLYKILKRARAPVHVATQPAYPLCPIDPVRETYLDRMWIKWTISL